jgi:hypothetical protein
MFSAESGKCSSSDSDAAPSTQGIVLSDWEGLDRITNPWGQNYKFSVEKGINAGIDMVSN